MLLNGVQSFSFGTVPKAKALDSKSVSKFSQDSSNIVFCKQSACLIQFI